MIKILLVDKHEIVLDTVSNAIDGIAELCIVKTGESIAEVREYCSLGIVDLMLLDESQFQRSDVIQLIATNPKLKIILCGLLQTAPVEENIRKLGAHGYMLKTELSKPECIKKAVSTVMGGNFYLSIDCELTDNEPENLRH